MLLFPLVGIFTLIGDALVAAGSYLGGIPVVGEILQGVVSGAGTALTGGGAFGGGLAGLAQSVPVIGSTAKLGAAVGSVGNVIGGVPALLGEFGAAGTSLAPTSGTAKLVGAGKAISAGVSVGVGVASIAGAFDPKLPPGPSLNDPYGSRSRLKQIRKNRANASRNVRAQPARLGPAVSVTKPTVLGPEGS
jgi:hypothetical protein